MSCSAGLAGFYVLVVEDEYYQAHDCCEWLRSAGATVAGPVRNGADAKHILARSKVDAVVVDINLGRGSDFELASHLTESGVPFIFATGYSQENIPAEFRHALTLQKPFNPQDLIVAVTSLRLTLAGSSVTTPGAPSLLPGRFESDLSGCSHRGESRCCGTAHRGGTQGRPRRPLRGEEGTKIVATDHAWPQGYYAEDSPSETLARELS